MPIKDKVVINVRDARDAAAAAVAVAIRIKRYDELIALKEADTVCLLCGAPHHKLEKNDEY